MNVIFTQMLSEPAQVSSGEPQRPLLSEMLEHSCARDPSIWHLTDLCWEREGSPEGKREEIKPRISVWGISAEGCCSAQAVQGEQRLIPSDSIQRHEQISSRFPELCLPSLSLWELPAQIHIHKSHWTFLSCLLNFWSIRTALNRQTELGPGVCSGVNHPVPCQETKAPAEKELDDLILISFLI